MNGEAGTMFLVRQLVLINCSAPKITRQKINELRN